MDPDRSLVPILGGDPGRRAAYSVLAALLVASVAAFVDLAPQVERDFFFSTDDPAVAANERIDELFPGGSELILCVAGDLGSPRYYAGVEALTRELERVPGVERVLSITQGPKNPRRGLRSPFLRRLVGGQDGKSTLVLVGLEDTAAEPTIRHVERLARQHAVRGLEIQLSGVPFVIERIRRNLVRDMVVFSSAAVVVFGLLVTLVFRSTSILAGTLVSCISACCLTLLGTRVLGLRIGILTANLVTIVFVMTLHHIIYLSFAWKSAAESGAGAAAVRHAVAEMLGASWWVMVTTGLGFGSLVLAHARPLRELGLSGALGAVVACASAYAIHPSFLHGAAPPRPARRDVPGVPSRWWAKRHGWAVTAFAMLAVFLATGTGLLNGDPSLHTYFAAGSPIRAGLERVDRNGGSSPLRLVVRDRAGAALSDRAAHLRLWALHRELERHPAVGVVLSLPLIMTEGKRAPFGFLLSRESLLERMERPEYGDVTHSFVTEDRRRAMFLLRMIESRPRHERLAVVEDLEAIVETHGFEAELIGGLYFLHGRLSGQVVQSLVTGVGQLLLTFLVVALLVSRNLRWSLALIATLGLVPAIVLGLLGHLRVPLDIISAPAVNIALGMAIDDMLHLTAAARSLVRRGATPWEAWVRARAAHWRPLLATMGTVASGFALLTLSSFPPTQRFGWAVVGGAVLDVAACLLVLPVLAAGPLPAPLGTIRRGVARCGSSRLLRRLIPPGGAP